MAVDASPKFPNSNLIQVPQLPNYHPEIVVISLESDDLQFLQFMIAGSIAGIIKHMAMFLIDTIKTCMQAIGSCPIQLVGIRKTIEFVLKSEGPKGLYCGIGAMGFRAVPAHAVYFSVYEVCKKNFSAGNPNNSTAPAVSGVFATVCSDVVFTLMDM